MKKVILIIIALSIIAATALVVRFIIGGSEDDWICENGMWVKHGSPSASMPIDGCSKNKITNFDECLAAGFLVMESWPRQCRTTDGQSFTEDIGNELDKIDLIRIENPRPNQEISSPLTIIGQARGYWFFEASFPVKLYDQNNNLVSTGIAQAQIDGSASSPQSWMTQDFIEFEATLEFEEQAGETGVLILEKDNPSGLPENADELRLPIVFGAPVIVVPEMLKLKVYFNNSQLDPEFSCHKVFPVERGVVRTMSMARAALEELLKGPTTAEKSQGYFTNINSGVKIQGLTIENGLAKVDFNQQLEYAVGGSCRVAAISSQIRQTLKQFSTVNEVIISIDGRTEDILQP